MPKSLSLAELRRWLALTPLTGPPRKRKLTYAWLLWRDRHQRIAQFYHWVRRQRLMGNMIPLSLNLGVTQLKVEG